MPGSREVVSELTLFLEQVQGLPVPPLPMSSTKGKRRRLPPFFIPLNIAPVGHLLYRVAIYFRGSNHAHHPGGNRKFNKAVESSWAGKISADELTKVATDVKETTWSNIKAHGVDYMPRFDSQYHSNQDIITDIGIAYVSGEFSLYDHVLNHTAALNAIPKHYVGPGLSSLDVYFVMGRGRRADGVAVPASGMKKWQVQ